METASYQLTVSEAERNILSLIINGKDKTAYYIQHLKPEIFSDERHRVIYSNILQMMMTTTPLDIVTLKAQLLKTNQLELAGDEEYLRELKNINFDTSAIDEYYRIILYAAKKRQLGTLGEQMIHDSNDVSVNPDETWSDTIKSLSEIQTSHGENKVHDLASLSFELLRDLDYKINSNGKTSGIWSGFPDLDKITGGFVPGELVVIAGRPAMGKSGFALSMLLKTCVGFKNPVAYFALELNAQSFTQRLLSLYSGIPAERIRRAELRSEEYQRLILQMDEIKNAPLYVVDSAQLTAPEIRLVTQQLRSQYNIQMIVIDYLQIIPSRQRKSWNREAEISEITRTLKQMARELDIVVVVTSQLSRAVETRGGDKKPILSDLRESGAIEQDADKVLFLYRGEYYGLDTDAEGVSTKNVAEIIVAKNRNGPVATVRMRFNPKVARFDNLEENEIEEMKVGEEKIQRKFRKFFGEDGEPFIDKNEPPF